MTLNELRATIKQEARYVDVRTHSHNIISISLQCIAKDFGTAEANRAIRDFKLNKKGWREEPEHA